MKRSFLLIIVGILGMYACLAALADSKVYKAQCRPAEELVELVRPVLKGGTATFDARTNSLILVGTSQQIGDALMLLKSLDKSLRRVTIRVRFLETRNLQRRDVKIDWAYAGGNYRIGTTSVDPSSPGFTVNLKADASHHSTSRSALQTLVILEGSDGFISTGKYLPITEWLGVQGNDLGTVGGVGGRVEVSTGFVVSPRILPDGGVMLTIEPKASYLSSDGPKEIVNRQARSFVTIKEGQRAILAGNSEESAQVATKPGQGASRSGEQVDWSMLLEVEVSESGE